MKLSDLNSNLQTPRPFLSYSAKELIRVVECGLSRQSRDIELATLAYDELSQRNKSNRVAALFKETGVTPIPWLKSARACLDILESPPQEHYQGHLYVILISGYTPQNQTYGAYVGASRYRPQTRFEQHKTGINASNKVQNRGIQPLLSLNWPWRTVPGGKDKREFWESALNRCLATKVPKVLGDYRPTEDWPSGFQMPLREILEK